MAFADADRQRGVVQSMGYGPTARLRDGVTSEQAEAALALMLAASDADKKAFNKGWLRAEAIPLLEQYVGDARSWMLMLFGAAAGVIVAWWGLGVLRGAMPASIPRAFSIGLDLRVLGFTSLVAIATGLVCGLLPALRGSRVDLVGGLKDGTGATAGAGRQKVRHMLAWAEIALAVMLLVGAGLFISSFARLMRVDQGFDASGITSLNYSLPRLEKNQQRDPDLVRRLLEAVRAIPDIEAAMVVNGGGPYGGGYSSFPVRIEGRPVNLDETIRYRSISTGFMSMLDVPLRAGRDLTPLDTRQATPVALVNDTAVRQFWGGKSPLGARFEINATTYEIVGVVGDMRYGGPANPPAPEAFLHVEQTPAYSGGSFLVRSRRGADSVLPEVKAAIWSVIPGRPITNIHTTEELFGRTTATRRFNMLLMSIFAALALVIAATGIYGVIAFVVGQRTREIGVRVALGARGSEVVGMFLRQGAIVIAAGITAGLIGAWLRARTVQTFLFEVEPRDPVVFTIVAVVLALVGLLACWIPARRAARIDPLVALRAE